MRAPESALRAVRVQSGRVGKARKRRAHAKQTARGRDRRSQGHFAAMAGTLCFARPTSLSLRCCRFEENLLLSMPPETPRAG